MVTVGVFVIVGVLVTVGVFVTVAVCVGVFVGVLVGVFVGVLVGVFVGVGLKYNGNLIAIEFPPGISHATALPPTSLHSGTTSLQSTDATI